MTGDADPEIEAPDTSTPTEAGRYASVTVDHQEAIIYDREIEEAWIQSDTVRSLDDLQ